MADDPQTLRHVPEAEAGVLGAMLRSNYAYRQVLPFLDPDDFYAEAYRTVYRTMVDLNDADNPIDTVTVVTQLRNTGLLDQVGGPAAIADLAGAGQPAHARAYAQQVKNAAVARKLVTFGQAATQAALGGDSITHVMASLQDDLSQLAAYQHDSSAVSTAADLVDVTLDRIDEIVASGGGLLGIPTGLPEIDHVLRGLQRTKLYLVAARPAMGKTTLAQNWIDTALDDGHRVLFFSLEMDSHELLVRMLASRSGIDKSAMDAGTIDTGQRNRLDQTATDIRSLPLLIDDRATQTIRTIRATSERTALLHGGLDLIVVDYVGLIEGEGNRENRQNEVATISRGLKVLAKDLDVPIVALSQLSRQLETRPDKRPKLSDLRDSGSLEQDADVVITLYRDEMYEPDTPDKGLVEVAIIKHRGGPLKLVKAAFLGHLYQIRPLAHSWDSPPPY